MITPICLSGLKVRILFYLLTDHMVICLKCRHSPMSVPNTSYNHDHKQFPPEETIKFLAPHKLKLSLQQLATERNISLSALLRLITSEYVKRHHTP